MKLKFFPAVVILLTLSARAQFATNEKIVDVRIVSSQDKIVQGEEFKLAIILNIKPTLHINSHEPLGEYYIPTEVKFAPLRNISFGQAQFPAPS